MFLQLIQIMIKNRTGELGIKHGANRFVSTNIPLKKNQIDILEKVAIKVGIKGGISRI